MVIAEKPDQANKLSAPYKSKRNDGYIEILPNNMFPAGGYITWAVGHLFQLADPMEYNESYKKWSLEHLPIIPETFKHTLSKGKGKQFNIIKKLLKDPKVNEIIIGTDAGREGEGIARTIIKMAGIKKPMKRLWVQSLTKPSVEKAFRNLLPASNYDGLYYESMSRAYSDWLVGINTSRAYSILWQRNGYKDTFSVGRVQTCVLAMIDKRDKEIENFKPEPFWEVYADFDINNKKYRGRFFVDDVTRLTKKEEAVALSEYCQSKHAHVEEVKTERKEYHPPKFYNLSSLQSTANKRYKYSPEHVLKICQELYMKEHISYPRTDSEYVTEGEAGTFPDVLDLLGKQEPYQSLIPTPISNISNNKRYTDSKKVSDHYALIPTENVPNLNDLTHEERNIYDLIAKSLIAAHYDKAVFDYTTIVTLSDDKFGFETKGKVMIQEGWRKVVFPNGQSEEPSEEENTLLPDVREGEEGTTADTEIKEGETTPPSRYTQGDLITLMKTAGKSVDDKELEKVMVQTEGLGTEATRASIIARLKDMKYISVKKNKVFVTDKGRMLIHALGESVLVNPALTAKWEKRLSEIGKGQANHSAFVEQSKKLAQKLVEEALNNEHLMKDMGTGHENKTQKSTKGSKKIQAQTKPDNPSPQKDVEKEVVEERTQEQSVKLKSFGPCKKCNENVVDKGRFYGCSGYSKTGCNFTFPKAIRGVAISEENVKLYLKKGETNLIKDIPKKEEGTFDAVLVWNGEKMDFRFPNKNVLHLPLNLLKAGPKDMVYTEDVKQAIQSIEDETAALKKPAKVVNVIRGPRVTRYELRPKAGVNITGYKRFKENIQAALKATSITLLIPVPGKNVIGIEVPNKKPNIVYLRSMLESPEYLANKKPLSFPIGVNVEGEPIIANLAEMPHLLVAGQTGSGKSVLINSLICSMLYSLPPEDLKMMFIDPKQVELSVYEDIPHNIGPIVKDPAHAEKALRRLVDEMMRRYHIFEKHGVRNLEAYKEKVANDPETEHLPFLVVVIDELADLMMTTDVQVEEHITRLTQLSRASGIHLIIATQRPNKKVLSTNIKANLPCRIAFSVSSNADSMTILDEAGAEDLLGRGDLLYQPTDTPKVRLQSAFVNDQEIEKVVQYLSRKYEEAN